MQFKLSDKFATLYLYVIPQSKIITGAYIQFYTEYRMLTFMSNQIGSYMHYMTLLHCYILVTYILRD